jgi:pyruvate,orthophosphate dikinase
MIVHSEYSRFYAHIRIDQSFVDAYKKFEYINTDLKLLITQWQTVELADKLISNDHSDADYDNQIIDKIGNLHERYQPILETMTTLLPRLSFYQDKLMEALEKAEDGEIQWVSDARLESYHTIWFEMHEDLLRVLGRVREE